MPAPIPTDVMSRPLPRCRGGATGWVLLALAVGVVVVLLVLFLPRGGGGSGGGGNSGGGPAGPNRQDTTQRLEDISQRLSVAIQNRRDSSPLIEEVRAVIASDPQSAEAHLVLAQVLLRSSRVHEAVEPLRRCLELNPDQPEVRVLLGTVMMQLDDYEAAQSQYAQVVSMRPQDADVRLKLAAASLKLGDMDTARDAALVALKLDPQRHEAHVMLSEVFEQQGRLALAESQMARALELVPAGEQHKKTRLIYIRRRAAMLRRANRPAEALAALREMPTAELYTPAVAQEVATTYAMLGEPGMAAQHYEMMVQMDPSNDAAAAEAVRWHLKAGDTAAARLMLDKLRGINPRYEAIPELTAEVGKVTNE